MRRYLQSSPLTIRCRLGDYTRAMMIKRILTICAAVSAALAVERRQELRWRWRSRAIAPPGRPIRPIRRSRYPQADIIAARPAGRISMGSRMKTGRTGQSSTALPPPGPVLSPDDPRYGRPMGAPPVYSDRMAVADSVRSFRRTIPVMAVRAAAGADRPVMPPRSTYVDRSRRICVRPAIAPCRGRRAAWVCHRIGSGGSHRKRQPTRCADGHGVVRAAGRMNSPRSRRRNSRRICAGRRSLSPTKEPPGTLIVDTPNTYLYYVLGGGRAIRYGVRVGRDGFTWTGVQKISRKAEWPDWHPPPEMIDRQPYLPRFMAGGPGNPLGARAMYLGNPPSIASTAPTSPRRSASSSPRAASAC